MLVVVGSLSRVKFDATRGAVRRLGVKCDVKPVKVDSGVGDQPVDMESLAGARNRARKALQLTDADFGVGIEGGLLNLFGLHYIGAVCCVVNRKAEESLSTTALLQVPEGLARRLKSGDELGDVMDKLTNSTGTKHTLGAVGILTGGKLTRTQVYEDAVVLAFSRFVKSKVFNKLRYL